MAGSKKGKAKTHDLIAESNKVQHSLSIQHANLTIRKLTDADMLKEKSSNPTEAHRASGRTAKPPPPPKREVNPQSPGHCKDSDSDSAEDSVDDPVWPVSQSLSITLR
jgi:hypothetical protein